MSILALIVLVVCPLVGFMCYKHIQQWNENNSLRLENERLLNAIDMDKDLLERRAREIALLNGFLTDAERDLGMMTQERDALAERLERLRPRSVTLDEKESETTTTVVNING